MLSWIQLFGQFANHLVKLGLNVAGGVALHFSAATHAKHLIHINTCKCGCTCVYVYVCIYICICCVSIIKIMFPLVVKHLAPTRWTCVRGSACGVFI